LLAVIVLKGTAAATVCTYGEEECNKLDLTAAQYF
jgi:hypothetical protein